MTKVETDALWYQSNLDVFLNRWYSNYEAARSAREHHGGFLLPYKKHFFVCEAEVIRALGLDPDDPDWERIKWNCANPGDPQAFKRLREKREIVMRG